MKYLALILCLTFSLTQAIDDTIIQKDEITDLSKFVDLLRHNQRDADQTIQSFQDVLKRDADWVIRGDDGKPIITEKCNNSISDERVKFGSFVLSHMNDFESCVDKFVDDFKSSKYTKDLNVLQEEVGKCISITRVKTFWGEFQKSIAEAKIKCLEN